MMQRWVPFLVCFLVALAVGAPARADLALFVSADPRALELTQALEVELRGYGVLAAFRAPADARSPLERAAAAQRVARHGVARVALWIEPGPPARLRAVGTSENDERIVEAPLPVELAAIDARAFAQIAASVVLEVLGVVRDGLPRPEAAELIVPMPPWSCSGDFVGLIPRVARVRRLPPIDVGKRQLPGTRGVGP
jgi:hypothetical protein